jgi:hypothetical protein
MNYSDILKALPKSVSDILQSKLDAINLTPDLSRSEVEELLESAVKLTRLEIQIEDDEKLRLVDTLLTFVAKAGANALFA